MRLEFSLIARRKLTLFLISTVIVLAALSILGCWLRYRYGLTTGDYIVRLFYFDSEQSFPTWFSSMTLLFAALLLTLIAAAKLKLSDRFRFQWSSLAVIFVLLAIDEVAGFHEVAGDLIRDRADVSGVFYFAWVIPGIAFVILLGLFLLRFLFHLPGPTRLLFVLAAVIFLTGVLGVEMIGSNYVYEHGPHSARYGLIVTLEEFLEMLGTVIFIHALTGQLKTCVDDVLLRVAPA